MNTPERVHLSDVENALRIEGNTAIIRRTQEIPASFLDDLADERQASKHLKMGNFVKAASIPVFIVEKWMAEGFNIYDPNNGLADILKRLQSEDMEKLLATEHNLI